MTSSPVFLSSDNSSSSSDRGGQRGPKLRGSEDGTQRLMSWNTAVAMIGLVLAVLSLAFTIWFSRVLRIQAEYLAPTAQIAAKLDSDVSKALAHLRGWLNYGDQSFVDDRRLTWRRIDRSFKGLERLATAQHGQQKEFVEFRRQVSALKYTQWAIEDVAHTPGNRPSNYAYHAHILPIQRSISGATQLGIPAIQAESTTNPRLFFWLSLFLHQFTKADVALQRYVGEPSSFRLGGYQSQMDVVRRTRVSLESSLQGTQNQESRATHGLSAFVLKEADAYQLRAAALIARVQQQGETVAQRLFRLRERPLGNYVSNRVGAFAERQAKENTATARLFQWFGLLVVAGALLIGAMSASSLYVSFRIRRRVSGVLARARRLGQYVVQRRLGEGGMGEVYLARHVLLRRPAAVKLIRKDKIATPAVKERFQSEVRLTCRLTHPNTVEIFDYGVTPEGTFYYAMEYLDGANLEQVVATTGAMPENRVIHILSELLGSLHEAHSLGLLHRDIKPANIMLCHLGGIPDSVKVLDFGLALDLKEEPESSANTGGLVGTALYLAPETILDAKGTEERSDLYAVGAVGYFLLCGRPPFEGEDTEDILCQHLSEAPVPLVDRLGNEVETELERIILSCLEKVPERRPASALELLERLEGCYVAAPWSRAERELWWREFGEVVERCKVDGQQSLASSKREFAVELGSRGGSMARSRA